MGYYLPVCGQYVKKKLCLSRLKLFDNLHAFR